MIMLPLPLGFTFFLVRIGMSNKDVKLFTVAGMEVFLKYSKQLIRQHELIYLLHEVFENLTFF